jgi:uncharacterized tellurite resistance protein B-like protein
LLLVQLETQEKFAFLRLAHFIAKADGSYIEEEQAIIQEYCFEMGIDDIGSFETITDLDEVLQYFKTKKSKKIVLLELMILAHGDDLYKKSENNILLKIAEKFEISQKEMFFFSHWGKAVSALRSEALMLCSDDTLC